MRVCATCPWSTLCCRDLLGLVSECFHGKAALLLCLPHPEIWSIYSLPAHRRWFLSRRRGAPYGPMIIPYQDQHHARGSFKLESSAPGRPWMCSTSLGLCMAEFLQGRSQTPASQHSRITQTRTAPAHLLGHTAPRPGKPTTRQQHAEGSFVLWAPLKTGDLPNKSRKGLEK